MALRCHQGGSPLIVRHWGLGKEASAAGRGPCVSVFVPVCVAWSGVLCVVGVGIQLSVSESGLVVASAYGPVWSEISV